MRLGEVDVMIRKIPGFKKNEGMDLYYEKGKGECP